MKRIGVLAFAIVALIGALAGCSATPGASSVSGTVVSAQDDAAAVAVAAAQARMRRTAPDAIPIVVNSTGIAITPPPAQWTVTFASKSKGAIYEIGVTRGRAGLPSMVGSATAIPDSDLKAVLDYKSLALGSDMAYQKAKAELAKTGVVPPQVIERLTLMKIPNMPEMTPGVWLVTFLNGTSTNGIREVLVDGRTGAVKVRR